MDEFNDLQEQILALTVLGKESATTLKTVMGVVELNTTHITEILKLMKAIGDVALKLETRVRMLEVMAHPRTEERNGK